MPKADLCVRCKKRPAASLMDGYCILCACELDAQVRITLGERLIEEGKKTLAWVTDERARLEQGPPPQEEDHAPP